MTAPSLSVKVFVPPTSLNDTTHFVVGSATRGLVGGTFGVGSLVGVDVASTVQHVSTRRGGTRALDSYEAGSATVTMIDLNGRWNPQNTASDLYPNILVGTKVRIAGTLNGVTSNVFTGHIRSVSYDYEKTGRAAWVTLQLDDLMGLMSQTNITTVLGWVYADDWATRITKIMAAAGRPFSDAVGNAEFLTSFGTATVYADPGTTRTVLAAVQAITDSTNGSFFIDQDGNMGMRTGHGLPYLYGAYQIGLFSDTGLYSNTLGFVIPIVGDMSITSDYWQMSSIRVSFDDTLVVNESTITCAGGYTYTSRDVASIAKYGRRSHAISSVAEVPASTTTNSDFADFPVREVRTRANPGVRCESIELDTWSGGPAAILALQAKLMQGVSVYHEHSGTTMVWGDTDISFLLDSFGNAGLSILGIDHDITVDSWRTTWRFDVPVDNQLIVIV